MTCLKDLDKHPFKINKIIIQYSAIEINLQWRFSQLPKTNHYELSRSINKIIQSDAEVEESEKAFTIHNHGC